VDNFLFCVAALLAEEAYVDFVDRTIRYQDRIIRVDAFPIGIDYEHISRLAVQPEMQERAQAFREHYPVEFIGIGVDRLDYTKGIPERLEAIRFFFDKYPQYRQRLMFIQIASPTRMEVPEYRQMKEQIDQMVGEINGRLSHGSWSPIQYIYRSVPFEEVMPYFLIADFALITPLRDGMNLVAKEYCASRYDDSGTLILSELTGAAYQLTHASQVSIEDVADAIHRALEAPDDVRRFYMASLRSSIASTDVQSWVRTYLEAFEYAVRHRESSARPAAPAADAGL
jgi:trehalose-6-phosphate synthase